MIIVSLKGVIVLRLSVVSAELNRRLLFWNVPHTPWNDVIFKKIGLALNFNNKDQYILIIFLFNWLGIDSGEPKCWKNKVVQSNEVSILDRIRQCQGLYLYKRQICLIMTTHKFGAKITNKREKTNLCFMKHISTYVA